TDRSVDGALDGANDRDRCGSACSDRVRDVGDPSPARVVAGTSDATVLNMTPPGRSDWDVVDQASLESFPASDPPAWGSHHAAASAATVVANAVTLEPPGPAERTWRSPRRARVATMVAAGIVLGGLVALGIRYLRDR